MEQKALATREALNTAKEATTPEAQREALIQMESLEAEVRKIAGVPEPAVTPEVIGTAIQLQPTGDKEVFDLIRGDERIGEILVLSEAGERLKVQQIVVEVPKTLTKGILQELEIQLKAIAEEKGLDKIGIQLRGSGLLAPQNLNLYLRQGYTLVLGSESTVEKPISQIGVEPPVTPEVPISPVTPEPAVTPEVARPEPGALVVVSGYLI